LNDGSPQLLKRLEHLTRGLLVELRFLLVGLRRLRLNATGIIAGLDAEGENQGDTGRASGISRHGAEKISWAARGSAFMRIPVHTTHDDVLRP
jgi:hypothetical protein